LTGSLRFLFADQLSHALSALDDLASDRDTVLLAEVAAETDHVPHHPKKIAFLFSAMRHFRAELAAKGIDVRYVTLDDPVNTGSFRREVERAVKDLAPDRVIVTEPGDYRVRADIDGWQKVLGLPVEIRPDDRFLCSTDDFARWAKGKKQLRMEHFYRWMRQRTGWLMEADGEPVGGQWNYDAENRKPARPSTSFPRPMRFTPDATTNEVLDLVRRRFANRFGDLEPFWFAVTAADARRALAHFIRTALADFGPHQDAMLDGEDWLFHSGLSHYLNCGLLTPHEVCRAVLDANTIRDMPTSSVEGFIRQILGWREYVRGIYWLKMPGYAAMNALGNQRHLPAFYWTGETEMRCMAHSIGQTRREALSHHIQRLMVTGNFALLAGVIPAEICAWYLAVYADAFEWVELPNTLGMVMHADRGYLGSKPYAASGNYIDKMSDFCGKCRYRVKEKLGPDACPFNYLYWNFMIENATTLRGNPRMGPIFKTLERMDEDRKAAIVRDAKAFLDGLEPADPGSYR
jgi:deoxyribodipyrimidine photolyase-related protein